MKCKDYEEGLAALAEGGAAPEAEAHIATCAACATRLGELRTLVLAARLPRSRAPHDLVRRAQGLMRPAPRRIARLLGNGLAAAGARSTSVDDFALQVGVDDVAIPLHYSHSGGTWEVAGRAPTAEWSVLREGDETLCGPSGRFRLTVKSLEESAFVLRGPGQAGEIEVPAASELVGRGA